jgi:hypothetical protein
VTGRQTASREVIVYGESIKFDAWRKLGEILNGTAKRAGGRGLKGGGRNRGSKKELLLGAPPTLDQLGIDKKTAMWAKWTAEGVTTGYFIPCVLSPIHEGLQSTSLAARPGPAS